MVCRVPLYVDRILRGARPPNLPRLFAVALGSPDPSRVRAWLQTLATPRRQPSTGVSRLVLGVPKTRFCNRYHLVSAETRTRAAEPANSQLFASRQEISANARLGGGGCTPDRTSLHLKFTANREINRECCRFRRSAAILASSRRANSMTSSEIPYAAEQGIFAGPNREFVSKNRELRKTAHLTT